MQKKETNLHQVVDEISYVTEKGTTKIDPKDLEDKVVSEVPTKALFNLAPERFEDETFEQYKERRTENNKYIKKFLKHGINVWDSSLQGTHRIGR